MSYIGNSPSQTAFLTDQFSGTGSQTAFTMSVAPANTASCIVAVSGVLQDPSTYAVAGTTLNFTTAPPVGSGNISVRYLGIPASGVTTTAYRTLTEFTATASQTTFTPPSYTVGFINVYRNGVLLGSADYTATNGTTVVLATGATLGDLITTESFLVSSVLNAIPNTTGSISSSNLPAGLTITTPTITSPTISTSASLPANTTLNSLNLTPYTMKNRIINGAMVIDQRNAGASITNNTVTQFAVDRFLIYGNGVASKFTAQQNAGSVTPPAGYTNYLGFTSLASTTVTSLDIYEFLQSIEGYNVADLDYGKSTAKTVTLSFWVRSSLTGTFGGALQNSNSTRSYVFSYTISAANTWEQKTITIPGDTSGTWLTTNGIGLQVIWGLGVGSTFSSTAGSWSGSAYYSVTGAQSIVSTNGATFYITGVQLEVGSYATPFEWRPYGMELQLCQRYYYKQTASSTYTSFSCASPAASTTVSESNIPVKVTMRTYPTTLDTSGICIQDGTNVFSTGTFTLNNLTYSPEIVCVRYTHGSAALTQYRPYFITANNNSAAYLGLGAEL